MRYDRVLAIVGKLTFNNIYMKKIIASGVLFAPFMALAQVPAGTRDVSSLLVFVRSLLTTATVIILAAAIVYFLWNVFKYVMAAGDEEKRKEGQSGIIYGIIGIAVMVSVYGLVNFFTRSANLDTTNIAAPTLNLPATGL